MFFETTCLQPAELLPQENDTQRSQDTETENAKYERLMAPRPYRQASHVVFVIHGIGQQTERYGMFDKHMDQLRETMEQVLQARMPHQEDIHVEMIPIEWHRHIHAEADTVVKSLLPKSIPTLRFIESDYLSDVLFYFAKDRGQSIINHCTRMFNSAYHDFMAAQPHFGGKVAIVGYSLGGLISWDILCRQRQHLSQREREEYSKFDVRVPKLDFRPDYLFGMGCPLGGMLAARNQDPHLYHPDPRIVFENIYHAFDPLAFRFEPLLDHDYAEKPPVAVDRVTPTTSFLSSLPLISYFTRRSAEEEVEIIEDKPQSLLSTSVNAVLQFFSLKSDDEEDDEEDLMLEYQQRRKSEGDILQIKKKEQQEKEEQEQASKPRTKRLRANSMPSLLRHGRARYHSEQQQQQQQQRRQVIQHQESAVVAEREVQDDAMLYNDDDEELPRLSSDSTESSLFSAEPQTPTFSAEADPMWGKSNYQLLEILGLETPIPNQTPALKSAAAAWTPPPPHASTKSSSLPGGRRIDYELTPASWMGMITNEYILGLRAHFSYWDNKDMLWHILTRLENIC